ncbi:hypothetical protein KCU65_g10004, partial [Aureobasidium melanogenum]
MQTLNTTKMPSQPETTSFIPQPDEIVIPALHAQIISNMRIINPNLEFPIITTGYEEELGSWGAMVWNSLNEIEYHVSGCHSAVDALRTLLSSTSCAIYTRYRGHVDNGDVDDADGAGEADDAGDAGDAGKDGDNRDAGNAGNA